MKQFLNKYKAVKNKLLPKIKVEHGKPVVKTPSSDSMSRFLKTICITVLYSSEEYKIQTYAGEYRDLKCLIQDKLFAEDFGQCGGMGRCGTCIVSIIGTAEVQDFQRNEATTLCRVAPGIANIRLSCQIPVDDQLSNLTIIVLENR